MTGEETPVGRFPGKQAENPIIEGEQRYRAIFENTKSGVAVYEPVADGNDFVFVDVNGAAERIDQIRKDTVIGKRLLEVFPHADKLGVFPCLQRVCQTGKPEHLKASYYRDERREGWRENFIYRLPTGEIVAIYDDITERKRLEEELKISQEKFSKAFLLSPDAISITRLADGIFVSVNEGVKRVLGYTENEVIDKSALELNIWANPEDRKRLIDRLKAEGKVENFEARFVTKEGNVRYGLMSDAIITLHGVEYILNVTRDITDQKVATDELHKALALADQLRTRAEAASVAKSEFLTNISHELRTPLTAIIGFSELLSDPRFGNLNEKQKGYVKEIFGAGHHLLELISGILDLAKVESGKMELNTGSVNLSQLLENAFTMIRQDAFKRGIKIELEIAEEFPRQNVWVDGVKLKQMVMNLLHNAIKFTPPGGEIKLKAQATEDEIMISVSDTGIGIKPQDQERIFDEFEQIDSSRSRREQGVGLGLSLTRRLVELHGGRISVESEGDNKGSVFRFVIPLVLTSDEYRESGSRISAPESATQCSHADILSGESNRPRILVVEDNSANIKLVTNLLEAGGYTTLQAFSAEEAINILTTQTPALILMDISLPGMDGLRATEVIKNNPATSHIPVIALTAHSMGDNKARALEAGCDAYILKPIDTNVFYNILSNLIKSAGSGAT